MKYKGIFYFFLIVFYSINVIGSEINIPKPLMNKSISYYIGENCFNYLNNMNLKSIENLATLTDF